MDKANDRTFRSEFGNTNSKDIWDNPLLCAQFLRDYTGIPILGNVQPEDITDETEKLRPFLGVEFEGDAVKKVLLHPPGGQDTAGALPVYVVALLEHKSRVDFDVAFQLLKYMVGIWSLHRNEQNGIHEGISSTRDFRYPLVIPIVYYEGRSRWTADLHWKGRVELSEMFGEYVPDFTYKVVYLHGYSNGELLSAGDEISLVMMLNRIQAAEDLAISQWPPEYREAAQRIIHKAPEAVLHLMAQIVYHFGLKLHVPEDRLRQCVKDVEDRNMGELWADMEEIDIQAEQRKTAEARQKCAEARQERDKAQQECDKARQERDEARQERDEAKRLLEEDALLIESLQAQIGKLKERLGDGL